MSAPHKELGKFTLHFTGNTDYFTHTSIQNFDASDETPIKTRPTFNNKDIKAKTDKSFETQTQIEDGL